MERLVRKIAPRAGRRIAGKNNAGGHQGGQDRVALALTGTPGTGKKSVAPPLAESLGATLIDLNAMALLHASHGKEGERIVDVRKLRSRLLRTERLPGSLIFGHLVPDVLHDGEADFVAVLRCEPTELKGRLVARGYPPAKVLENVEAELIGLLLDGSVRAFGAPVVHEYDTTGADPVTVAARIARDLKDKAVHDGPWIDWTVDYDSSTKLRSLLSSARTDPAST